MFITLHTFDDTSFIINTDTIAQILHLDKISDGHAIRSYMQAKILSNSEKTIYVKETVTQLELITNSVHVPNSPEIWNKIERINNNVISHSESLYNEIRNRISLWCNSHKFFSPIYYFNCFHPSYVPPHPHANYNHWKHDVKRSWNPINDWKYDIHSMTLVNDDSVYVIIKYVNDRLNMLDTFEIYGMMYTYYQDENTWLISALNKLS